MADPTSWNPIAGNPFATRADLARAVTDLVEPLVAAMSPDGARVRLGSAGAHFSDAAADLEGWARPLWGIVPLVAGGGDFPHWDRYRAGLVAGTDPTHPEFWGPLGHDQRQVEAAAIGCALALVPERIWDPLTGPQRDQVARWLDAINQHDLDQNNHQFFRVMVDLGLRRVGVDFDSDRLVESLELMDEWYEGDGWYRDGWLFTHDHYVPMAFHFYGLLYAHLAGDADAARADRYRERAAQMAQHYRLWFDDDGRAIPYGRSMTYRFALAGFWGALALCDEPGLPWGEIRELVLGHLRWWARQPIARPDGVLTVGYGYDQALLAEEYNSPGSPYWCMKAFAPLLVGDDHPFWSSPRPGAPSEPALARVHVDRAFGARIANDGRHAVMLNGGQANSWFRQSAAKYGKLAYSSAFGFSVESDHFHPHHLAPDSALVLSDAPGSWRARTEVERFEVLDDGRIWSRWRPWPDVVVDTILDGGVPWHTRVHLVRTERELLTLECGFAIGWDGADAVGGSVGRTTRKGLASVTTRVGTSTLVEHLTGDGSRRAGVMAAAPNTNLVEARTLIPTLSGSLAPGEHVLACAAGGLEHGGDASLDPSSAPGLLEDSIAQLRARTS